jgi:hypothetical protein
MSCSTSPEGKRWAADNFGRSLRDAIQKAKIKWLVPSTGTRSEASLL